MDSLFKKDKLVFYLYFFFSLFCLFFIFRYSKFEIHIFLNQFHAPIFDFFFKYITFLGDGIVIISIAIILIFIRFRYFLLIIMPYLISGFFVQVFKRIIFPGMERPVKYFEGIYNLYFIEGVKLHSFSSFPSGHSATAFAFFIILAFLSNNRLIKIICLLIAVLVGYSRIYLSQHFLIDVWAGSLFGIVTAVFIYIYIDGINNTWIDKPVYKFTK